MDRKCVCKDGFSGDFCQIGKYTCCQGKRLLTTVYDIISANTINYTNRSFRRLAK